jgi:hypothetical protein
MRAAPAKQGAQGGPIWGHVALVSARRSYGAYAHNRFALLAGRWCRRRLICKISKGVAAQASFQYDNEFPAAAQDASDAAGDRDREP